MALSPEEKAAYQKKWREEKAKEADSYKVYTPYDEAGDRYKSEVLSYRELCNLYYGIKLEAETEKEDEGKKYKKKNVVRPAGTDILGEKLTFPEWLELRDKARKNLFWLGRDVLKKDLIPYTHQVVCDQFVQKNFDGVFKKGYTLRDVHKAIEFQVRKDIRGEDTREMMLLDPRGFYKSTIDGIDCVQWMLNVPDIRILILTGEYKLAVAFMKEIKEYFYLAEGAEPKDLHLLFPEYILTGVDGTSKEPIECPARKHSQKEPSLWVNSIDANLSGWHCDIRKTDDIVTDRNCNTKDTREALKEKADGTDNLLDEWGFSDYIGTRYWVDDYYGTRLKPDEDNQVLPITYFCRQCWTVKPEYVEVPLKKLEEHMVVLTFPEKATWKALQRKLRTNERSFRNQQLNEPTSADEDSSFKITFLEEVLRQHSYQPVAAPKQGDVFICWDWAASANKQSDYSAGVVGRIYPIYEYNQQKDKEEIVSYGLVILEVVCDKWKSSELAYQIVALDKKWHPKQTLIEKSNGAELLQLEVQRNAVKYGVSLNIYWKPVNQQPDAKRNRIKGLETLLNQNRLWFVLGPWIDQMFGQFVAYTGERKNHGRKDDIPDAASFFSFFLPTTEMSEDRKKLEEIMIEQAKARQQYERIFGSQPVALRPQPIEIPQKSLDPRMRIFGNNGLHL